MELNSILFSRIAWAGRIVQPPGGIYMKHAVSAMRDFGNFVEYPERLEDFDLSRGITFKHGIYRATVSQTEQVVIGEVSIFENGIIVTSQSPTEDMDAFLLDLIEQLHQRLRVKFELIPERKKNYTSQLEVVLAEPPPPTEIERKIAERISNSFRGIGSDLPPFEKTGVSFSFDTSHLPDLPPARFIIERRAGMPYSSNTYFTDSSLPTLEHLAALHEFEEATLGQ